MSVRRTTATAFAAFLLGCVSAVAASDIVTIYSADGLHDGTQSWFGTEFEAFTKATGIKVQYIEAGSSGVVERAAREKANPQADVLVTLPPFIQRAAQYGLLRPYAPAGADMIEGKADLFLPLVNNYMNFIYNVSVLKEPPKTFAELLGPRFQGKIQYSTPGQSGNGTAVMMQVIHAFGGREAGFAFLTKLQDNNVGPSASAGKLTGRVDNGELYIANGDLQMNMAQMVEDTNVGVFWPAGPDNTRSTFALPYSVGLVMGAPNGDNGKKLIDFLLTREAQESVAALAFALPVRKDVAPTDANFVKLHEALRGVTVWTPDWEQALKDLPADVELWRTATGN